MPWSFRRLAWLKGRSCHAIELNPAYVDVAVRRWQAFTGERAVLDVGGKTFDDVASERTGPQETGEPTPSEDGAAVEPATNGAGARLAPRTSAIARLSGARR